MKILVIRLKHIGDALLCLPVCESLRRTFPQAQIDYLLYEHIAPLFDNHPAIDNVVTITDAERKSVPGYLSKILALRKHNYDLVLDLMTSPISAFVTFCTGAQSTIGFNKGKWRSFLYKTRIPHDRSLGWLGSKLAILSGLSQTVILDRTIRISLSPAEIESMQLRMRTAGIDTEKPVVVFSPISRLGLKNWPAEYFVRLIERVVADYDLQAVLIWGPGEQKAVHAIGERVQSAKVFTSIDTRDLRELAALAANCVLFVGNDSGPQHVAEAAGTATFTIFPPDVRKTIWSPLLDNRHQALDMTDVLGIDEAQWSAQAGAFRSDYEHYYRKITPELAYQKLTPMLREVLGVEPR